MTSYARYCFHNLNLLPSQFDAIPRREKAMVIAFIQKHIEEEKAEEKRMKQAAKARRK